MIEIIFSNRPNNKCELIINGHSGWAKRGEDIICAAVSALAQTFVGGCEAELNAKADGRMDSGSCQVTIEVPKAEAEKLQAVYKVINFGFQRLQEAYPEHIKRTSLQGD